MLHTNTWNLTLSLSLMQVCEKEKLLSERNQLKVCMSELWQNLSFLSQQVCREVQGGEPPSVSASIDLTSNPPSPQHSKASRRPAVGPGRRQQEDGRPGAEACGQESPLGFQSTEEVFSPTVTVDFCQEMTEKCTTEEQKRHDGT